MGEDNCFMGNISILHSVITNYFFVYIAFQSYLNVLVVCATTEVMQPYFLFIANIQKIFWWNALLRI